MAYTRGTSANIVVGAAALFVSNYGTNYDSLGTNNLPAAVVGESYKDSLSNRVPTIRNVGYTSNGLDITFTPTFGDVNVDQLLDVARLYKSGMTVTMKTSFAEATLENLLLAIAQKGAVSGSTATYAGYTDAYTSNGSITNTYTGLTAQTTLSTGNYMDILSGDLGDYPVERSIIAVGPSVAVTGTTTSLNDQKERIYAAYRAVSITNVTISAKRDAASMFDVEFRLLPDNNGAYGKIIDRTY
jgi:hypothetical protein